MAKLGWKEMRAFGSKIMANYREKGFKRFFREDVLQSQGSPKNKAQAIALGTFMAFSPFLGFQTITALVISMVFRLNKVLAFVFCHVTLPPLIPFLMVGQLYLGGILLNEPTNFSFSQISTEILKKHLAQYQVGSFLSAAIMAALFGFGFYWLLQKKEENEPAVS